MRENEAYQRRELMNFLNQKNRYFDTVKEFSANLEDMDILQQIEWIENGSYGDGACFALQKFSSPEYLKMKRNKRAHVGHIVLHAFYGCPFRYWNKLSDKAKDMMNVAVDEWMKQKHEWAQILDI
jgi:hypothetical protein